MAKKVKTEEIKEELPNAEVIEETTEVLAEPEPDLPEPEVVLPEPLVIDDIPMPEHTVLAEPEPVVLPELVEAVPEQKEVKDSDEIGFLYLIMDTMESGGWGKALHPMIKSRIEHLRSK